MPLDHLLPAFLIIGEQKSGTSSMYRYLVEHPEVLPCTTKEPQFFSQSEEKIHQDWEAYKQLFPKIGNDDQLRFSWPELDQEGQLFHEEVIVERSAAIQYITGEASANTFRKADPSIVKQYLPEIKLILLLRDPVDRAYSLHRMFGRFQEEGREMMFEVGTFEEDIQAEMRGESQTDYLKSGQYIEYLPGWIDTFGKEAIKIIFTEEMSNREKLDQIMEELLGFLNLSPYDYGEFLDRKFNKAPQAKLEVKIRNELKAYFKPYNEALASYLGIKLPWE